MSHDLDYNQLTPTQLVDLLADKKQRYQVIVALVGGITSTELRTVKVSPEAKAALIAGLKHRNSKVRWWCIQLMDHLADESYLEPLLDAAHTDRTPKNRRHAIHALACEKCKPNRCRLNLNLRADLRQIAATDPELSVRLTALQELAELVPLSEIRAFLAKLPETEQNNELKQKISETIPTVDD
jgi:HEAT repeat protein